MSWFENMNPEQFARFLQHSSLSGRSDSEKVRIFISWCKKNQMEEVILRLSSEEKGGWSRNLSLDFTTERLIVCQKSFLTKFSETGFVAGLAPYPYLMTKKDMDPSKIRKQAIFTPNDLLKSDRLLYHIAYSDIEELVLRKGMETTVTNMLGRAIVSNFLTVRAAGKAHSFTLPANKNGMYEHILFWLSTVLPVKVTGKVR